MIRLVTYSHFIKSAQFEKLDNIKTFSRADIDNKIDDWKRDIGYDELSKSSQRLLDVVSDFCADIDWDYSDQMKRWLDASRKGQDVEELKPYCKDGQSVRDFLKEKRNELCNSTGVDSFTGSVINYEKDYFPWVQFQMNFYLDEVGDYILQEHLSEQMGDCCHELDMVQKRREMRKWLKEKAASFHEAAEGSGMISQAAESASSSYDEGYNR